MLLQSGNDGFADVLSHIVIKFRIQRIGRSTSVLEAMDYPVLNLGEDGNALSDLGGAVLVVPLEDGDVAGVWCRFCDRYRVGGYAILKDGRAGHSPVFLMLE